MVHRWNRYAKQDSMWIILTHPDKRDGKWDEEEFFATGQKDIQEMLQWVDSEGVTFSDRRALDFGCGIGRLTQGLCDRFKNCVGVDISKEMVEQAKAHNKFAERCDYVVNESDALEQFEDSSFSFVFTSIVLQHIHPTYSKKYLHEFVRILEPGGVLVFQLPVERVGKAQAAQAPAKTKRGLKQVLSKSYYGVRGLGVELKARLVSKVRFLRGEMDVEMHGLPATEVIEHMQVVQADCLAHKEDLQVANEWTSNWYIFIKR